jgi:hypothetical protein
VWLRSTTPSHWFCDGETEVLWHEQCSSIMQREEELSISILGTV